MSKKQFLKVLIVSQPDLVFSISADSLIKVIMAVILRG